MGTYFKNGDKIKDDIIECEARKITKKKKIRKKRPAQSTSHNTKR